MGKKYKVDQNFFNSWSKEMAYILGFSFADGSLENDHKNRGKYVRFGNTELNTIQLIKEELKSCHTIRKEEFKEKRKPYYLLRIGNSALYDSLIMIGLKPKKSLSMEFPNLLDIYFWDFVRGYFDGDGCVYNESFKALRVIFSSGSKTFLESLSLELQERINKIAKVIESRRSYQLRYSTNDSLLILEKMYHNTPHRLMMMRKYKIYREFLVHRHGVVAKW